MNAADVALLTRLLERVDATIDGAPQPETVPTGFPGVDTLLGGGLRRGDLVALGGDTGSGKSAFALAVALRAAAAGRRVTFLTNEMRPERVVERALCIEGRVRVDDLRNGTLDDAARAAIGTAALRLREAPLTVTALPAGGALDEWTDGVPRVPPPALIVVDSLHALAGDRGRPLEEELAVAVRALKRLALERDAVVLLLSHLTPRGRTPTDARPTLGDFATPSAAAQHADVLLALFREEMYDAAPGTAGGTELLVLKNRNGPTGYVDLFFRASCMRFEDMLDPER